MFDPAAMGTLVIGLGGDPAETASGRSRAAVAARRRQVAAHRRPAARALLARALRGAAARLDRPVAGELAGRS